MDLLTCSICIDLLDDPITILCGHTFCRNCLILMEAQLEYTCPMCREPFSSRNVQTNFLLQNLINSSHPNRGIQPEHETPEITEDRSCGNKGPSDNDWIFDQFQAVLRLSTTQMNQFINAGMPHLTGFPCSNIQGLVIGEPSTYEITNLSAVMMEQVLMQCENRVTNSMMLMDVTHVEAAGLPEDTRNVNFGILSIVKKVTPLKRGCALELVPCLIITFSTKQSKFQVHDNASDKVLFTVYQYLNIKLWKPQSSTSNTLVANDDQLADDINDYLTRSLSDVEKKLGKRGFNHWKRKFGSLRRYSGEHDVVIKSIVATRNLSDDIVVASMLMGTKLSNGSDIPDQDWRSFYELIPGWKPGESHATLRLDSIAELKSNAWVMLTGPHVGIALILFCILALFLMNDREHKTRTAGLNMMGHVARALFNV